MILLVVGLFLFEIQKIHDGNHVILIPIFERKLVAAAH